MCSLFLFCSAKIHPWCSSACHTWHQMLSELSDVNNKKVKQKYVLKRVSPLNNTFMLKSRTIKLLPSLANFLNLSESNLSNFWTNLDNESMEKGPERRRLIRLWLSTGTQSKLFFPTASAIDLTYPLLNNWKSFVKIVFAPTTLGTNTWTLPNNLVLNHFPYLCTKFRDFK